MTANRIGVSDTSHPGPLVTADQGPLAQVPDPVQTELLYQLAGEPKRLRWTEGLHIEPDRSEIIKELLAIADEEMAFLNGMAP